MRALGKMTWVEAKLFFREPAAVFFTLAFPVMLLLLFTAMFGNGPVPGAAGLRMVDVSAPGYAAMIVGTVGLIGLPINLTSYRQQGILKRLRATPLHPATVLGSQVMVNLLMTVLGVALLVGAARLFYGMRPPEAPLPVAVAFVLASLAFLAIGFVLAGLLPSVRVATALGQILMLPMFFLSGAVWPREMLPDLLRHVSDFLPLTYVVELVQGLWLEGAWNPTALAVLAGVLVASVAVSAKTFRWE